jgi:hypothetical protein
MGEWRFAIKTQMNLNSLFKVWEQEEYWMSFTLKLMKKY